MGADQKKTAYELMGIDEPPATTRDRLIHTALNLFYYHGFHAVGIDRIIADVGVTKTTFYNHFESKDQLILEALTTRDRWELETWMRIVNQLAAGDPQSMLLAVFDVLHDWFTHPDFLGCQFINAAAEFPSPNDPIHQAAARHKEAFEQAITDMARDAGLKNPEDLAVKWMVLIEGAINLRQVMQNDHAAASARGIAELLLREHSPDPSV